MWSCLTYRPAPQGVQGLGPGHTGGSYLSSKTAGKHYAEVAIHVMASDILLWHQSWLSLESQIQVFDWQ